MIRTRFAPSPTGDLHLGGAWVALASWVMARRAGGSFVMRVEDLDRPRVVPGAEARIAEDLRWLGLAWDGTPERQSQRAAHYEAALTRLTARGLTYPCDCSRAEIARSASAPHPGEETVYPGTCRDRDPHRAFKREPAIRLRTDSAGTVAIEDGVAALFAQDIARDVGDFVLRRGDGIFAYQLAVAVDDLAMGITDVVRGADLLASTPRQVLLVRLLGGQEPRYWHLPLVAASDGERLAKRTPGATLRDLRAAGIPASAVIGRLSHALGLRDSDAPCSAAELASARDAGHEGRWPREPWRIPADWAAVATPSHGTQNT